VTYYNSFTVGPQSLKHRWLRNVLSQFVQVEHMVAIPFGTINEMLLYHHENVAVNAAVRTSQKAASGFDPDAEKCLHTAELRKCRYAPAILKATNEAVTCR
jgi:hypothetical protein